MGIGGAGRHSTASFNAVSSQQAKTGARKAGARKAGRGAHFGQASVPKPVASDLPEGQTMRQPTSDHFLETTIPIRFFITRFNNSEKKQVDIQNLVLSASNHLSHAAQSVAKTVNSVHALRAALKVGKQRPIIGITREIYENAICQLEKIGSDEAKKSAVELLKLAIDDEVCCLPKAEPNPKIGTLEVNLHGDELFPGPEAAGHPAPQSRDIRPPSKVFCQTVVRYYGPYMLFGPVKFITGKGKMINKNHVLAQLNEPTLFPTRIKADTDKANPGVVLSKVNPFVSIRTSKAAKACDAKYPALGLQDYLKANPSHLTSKNEWPFL